MSRWISLFIFVSYAFAQDGGTVLGLMVNATTLRNTAKVEPAQAEEIDHLLAAARKGSEAKNYAISYRDYQHALTLLRGEQWTPAKAWNIAVTLKPDHSVVEPGQQVNLRMAQSFELDKPFTEKPFGTVYLTPFFSDQPKVILKTFDRMSPEFDKTPLTFTVRIPGTPDGPYKIVMDFDGVGSKAAPVVVLNGVMAGVAKSRARIAKVDVKKASELPSAEGHLAKIEAADRGELGDRITRIDCRFELSQANRLLADIEIGKDPFTKVYGDLQKSYRSAIDNTMQPYRLFIPSSYDGKQAYPLIILLHGMGGDENTMFDQYGNGAFENLAEKRGYIVACPKGREATSMYRGPAEQDVLDVLADVRRAYKVDPNRIYMAGHSMGAYGTWSIAMNHPEIFAALAPISGGADTTRAAKIAKIPELVVHGDADPTVPVANSRNMVEALKKDGAEVKYMEIKGGNHVAVAVPAFEPMFDWFDAHRK
jgi:predicted esterase